LTRCRECGTRKVIDIRFITYPDQQQTLRLDTGGGGNHQSVSGSPINVTRAHQGSDEPLCGFVDFPCALRLLCIFPDTDDETVSSSTKHI
jgi:hypothetical protein